MYQLNWNSQKELGNILLFLNFVNYLRIIVGWILLDWLVWLGVWRRCVTGGWFWGFKPKPGSVALSFSATCESGCRTLCTFSNTMCAWHHAHHHVDNGLNLWTVNKPPLNTFFSMFLVSLHKIEYRPKHGLNSLLEVKGNLVLKRYCSGCFVFVFLFVC